MHARFNNASSSMRSQRVGSFLTSTRTLLTLHPPPSRNLSAPRSILFFVHSRRCTRSVVVHRVCTSEQASASSTCFSLFYETCEKRLLTRVPYSYGNPFFSLELAEARAAFHDFELFDFRSFLSPSSSFSILIPIPLLLSYLSSLPPSFSLFHSFFLFFFSLCYFSSSLFLSLLFFSFVLKISWLKTLPRKFCFFTKFTSY